MDQEDIQARIGTAVAAIRDHTDFREDLERLSAPGLSKKQAKIIRKAIYDTIDARVLNAVAAHALTGTAQPSRQIAANMATNYEALIANGATGAEAMQAACLMWQIAVMATDPPPEWRIKRLADGRVQVTHTTYEGSIVFTTTYASLLGSVWYYTDHCEEPVCLGLMTMPVGDAPRVRRTPLTTDGRDLATVIKETLEQYRGGTVRIDD